MAKRQKMWVYAPPKPPAPKVPESTRAEVESKARELVKTVLEPRHIKPPPEPAEFNYVVDIYTRWYRHYFYLCARYACPSPHALSPFFELKFARLEYTGSNRFKLSYMRHTGQWLVVYQDLSPDECLAVVRDGGLFQP